MQYCSVAEPVYSASQSLKTQIWHTDQDQQQLHMMENEHCTHTRVPPTGKNLLLAQNSYYVHQKQRQKEDQLAGIDTLLPPTKQLNKHR